MEPWGEFSEDLLARLRRALDQAEYWRTRELPAYPTRQVFPLHDLAFWWAWRQGRAPELGSCSHPSRYHRRLARRYPRAWELYRLFFHYHRSPGILELPGLVEDGRALAQVTAVGRSYLLSSIPGRSPGEFVYFGDDSTLLLREVQGWPGGGRALDMACGCGVIALNLPERFDQVEGLDLNETAIRLAQSNLKLNPRPQTRFAVSDLWKEARGTYDLVIGNPPSLPLLPDREDLRFARGGARPEELTLRVVEGLQEHLAPGGLCLLTVFSAGEALWEGLRLPPGFSLDYRILDQVHLRHPEVPLVNHVLLHLRRDGRGERRRSPMTWSLRARRWVLPWGRPEPFPQQERLHPA